MKQNPSQSPVVNMVIQRGAGDCGIASLAMYLGIDYEDVLAAATLSNRNRRLHRHGMYWGQLKRTAATLGVKLTVKRAHIDLDEDCGILDIEHRTGRHVLLLKWGKFYDTDGQSWEPEVYLRDQDGVVKALYYVKSEGDR